MNTWWAAHCRKPMEGPRRLPITALPPFLKTYIDRLSFSFTDYLRQEKDSSTELHQWIRRNYTVFRDLELSFIMQRGGGSARAAHNWRAAASEVIATGTAYTLRQRRAPLSCRSYHPDISHS